MKNIDIRRLDFNLLLIFLELMRYRKATLVAERLNLTQSTISHALNRLRGIFDDDLFLRRPNGFEPTGRAMELEPVIRGLVDTAEQVVNAKRDSDFVPADGYLRIGGSDYSCGVFAAPLMQRCSDLAPALTLAIRPLMRRQTLDALIYGELDFGVGYFWGETPGVVVELLYKDSYSVVARADHPAIRNGGITLDDYAAAGHVLVSYEGDSSGLVDEVLEDKGRKRRIAVTVPFFLPALAIVAGGDLICTMPTRLAHAHGKRFGLVTVDTPFPMRALPVFLAWHERARGSALHTWAAAQIRKALNLGQ